MIGTVFGAVARLRDSKPLHPRGTVFDATVRRTGSPEPWGSEWLDDAGEDHGLVRSSRAAGLPSPLPDVLGLALTFTGVDGDRHDLLLATTGLLPGARFVLLPRRDPQVAAYGSLLPYRAPRGLVLISATPSADDGARSRFQLRAAAPGGSWQAFATLELTARTDREANQPIRFDPVHYVLPGLDWPPALARLREPAYSAARRAWPGPAAG